MNCTLLIIRIRGIVVNPFIIIIFSPILYRMSSRQQFSASGKRTQLTPSPKKKQSSQSSPTKKLKVKDDKRSKFFCALEITTRPVVHSFSPSKFESPSKFNTPMKDVNSPVSVTSKRITQSFINSKKWRDLLCQL